MFKKVVVAGGGVLGTQIALMCAYTGHDTTIWLRLEVQWQLIYIHVDFLLVQMS